MSSEVTPIYSRRLFPGPRLPPELVDVIIDHLHDDKKSLGTCSLVCKTWTHSARFHLFSDVNLCGSDPDIRELLESAPAVIPFIRHLRLNEQHWDHWNNTLPLFVGFKRIRSLTATNLLVIRLGAQAVSALFHNFSVAVDVRLENVVFDTADQLVRFICAFPHLQRLAVHCNYFAGIKAPRTTLRLSPYLRVLELNSLCIREILDWFLSLSNRPALRAVGLHPTDENNSEAIARLLLALENSLELFLISTAIAQGSGWEIDLRRNTCLRSLQIEFDNADDARLVTQILSQISSSHMEEVGLESRLVKITRLEN